MLALHTKISLEKSKRASDAFPNWWPDSMCRHDLFIVTEQMFMAHCMLDYTEYPFQLAFVAQDARCTHVLQLT